MTETNRVIYGAIIILITIIAACTFLVAIDKVPGDDFMLVVVGPTVGGVVGLIAGVKGVQQGTQAALSPPPPDA